MQQNNQKNNHQNKYHTKKSFDSLRKTRGPQEPVIAHLVFNLTSKVDRKWGCYT